MRHNQHQTHPIEELYCFAAIVAFALAYTYILGV